MFKQLTYIVLVALIVTATGCASHVRTASRTDANVVLSVNPEQYTMRRLPEVKESGRSFWGIPSIPPGQKQGIVFTVNGVRIDRTSQILPAMTLVGLTLITGTLIDTYVFPNPVVGTTGVGDFVLSSVLALPITGAINNLIWSNTATSVAALKANYTLLANHPTVDVFVNPKVEIESYRGLWSQTSSFSVKAIGATFNDDTRSSNLPVTTELQQEAPVMHAASMAVDTTSLAQVRITPEQAKLMQANYFKKGDRVRFTVNLNTRNKKGAVEIPEGVIYDVKKDNVYINYTYENRKRKAVKNFKEVSYAYSQILENYPMNNKGERILHTYQIGDEVAFKARVVIPDVKGNFDIPKGIIIGIDGNTLIIEFPFLRYVLTANKHFSEVTAVKRN